MVRGRGVEVQARVGDVVVAVVAQHALHVADAHVVADDREIGAAELLLGDREVARGRGERLDRVEALVDRAAALAQPGHERAVALGGGAPQRAPDAPRARGVDLHLQQVAAGLGEDLGQPDGALELRVGGRVGAPGALEQDDRLERVGLDVRGLRGGLDERPVARDALGAGAGAARRLGVDDVGVAAGGVGGEGLLATRGVGERVVVGAGAGGEARVAGLAAEERDHGDRRQDGDDDQHEHAAGEGSHPPTGWQIGAGEGPGSGMGPHAQAGPRIPRGPGWHFRPDFSRAAVPRGPETS